MKGQYQGWTSSEDRRLRELHAAGVSANRIGERLGRSAPSVSGRLAVLGLRSPNRKEKAT